MALIYALSVWLNVRDRLPLSPVQEVLAGVLLVGGLVVFGARAVLQLLRWDALRGRGPDPS